MITVPAAHTTALASPIREVGAALRVTPYGYRVSAANLSGSPPSIPNPLSNDIGRTASLVSNGVFRMLRVHHEPGKLVYHRVIGDPGAVATWSSTAFSTGTGNVAFDAHACGAILYVSGGTVYGMVSENPSAYTFNLWRYDVGANTWSLHQTGLSLPGGTDTWYSAMAFVTTQVIYCLTMPAANASYLRLWRGTFSLAPFGGTLTWTEMPTRIPIAQRSDWDKYRSSPFERFNRKAINGFDAVRLPDGRDLILFQDAHNGRSQLVFYQNGAWSDPHPLIPMDVLDQASETYFCRLTVVGNEILATGRLTRPDDASGVGFDCLAKSRDGVNWCLDRDAYLTGTGHYGQMVVDTANLRAAYVARNTMRVSEPLTTTTVYPLSVTIEHGADSIPTAEIEVPAGTTIEPGRSVTVELGYSGTLAQVGVFNVDRVQRIEQDGMQRDVISLREAHGKRLNDLIAPHTIDVLSQTKKYFDFRELGHHWANPGSSPRDSIKSVTVANTVVITGAGHVIQLDLIGTSSEGPVKAGEVLRIKNAQDLATLELKALDNGTFVSGTTWRYKAKVRINNQSPYSLNAGSALICDEVIIGRATDVDSINLVLGRRMRSQQGVALFRFSEHDHTYREQIAVQIHKVDDNNTLFFQLQKEDNGAGATRFRWKFGHVVEGTVTIISNGTFDYSERVLVRWDYRRNRVRVWTGTNGVTWTERVNHLETTISLPSEAGLGFIGNAEVPKLAIPPFRVEAGHGTPYRIAVASNPSAFPPSGWVRIGNAEGQSKVQYSSRKALSGNYWSSTRWYRLTNPDGYPGENDEWPGTASKWDVAVGDGLTWPTTYADTWNGAVAEIRQYAEGYDPNIDDGAAAPKHTYHESVIATESDNVTFERALPAREIRGTDVYWVKFWPAFSTVTSDWGSWKGQGVTVSLDVDENGEALGTAVDTVWVCDHEQDLSISEAAAQIAAYAHVPLDIDLHPNWTWTTESGAWTVDTPGDVDTRPAITGSGRVITNVSFIDGVFKTKLVIGQGRLVFKLSSGERYELAFESNQLRLQRITGVTEELGQIPYQQGVTNGRTVDVRVSLDGHFLSVWINRAFQGAFADKRFQDATKTLGFASASTTSFTDIEVVAAYERIDYLVDHGASFLEAIRTLVGQRRLSLLYRNNRIPRFGPLDTHEHAGALQGRSLVIDHLESDDTPFTHAQVRGAFHIVEATLNPNQYPYRHLLTENGDLLTIDACAREAQALLRKSQEYAETLTLEADADLRVEREDTITFADDPYGRTWIVDSLSTTFIIDQEEASLTSRLGLRKVV